MSEQGQMRRVRSGDHLTQIGDIWYYLRVVPPAARDVFGKTKVKKSLGTSSHTEAKRLEKIEDVEFEATLKEAREVGPDGYSRNPQVRTEQIVGEVYGDYDPADPVTSVEQAIAQIPAQYREDVRKRIEQYEDDAAATDEKLDQFWKEELRDLLFASALYADDWPTIRGEITGLLRDHAKKARTEHSLRWAYAEWLRERNPPDQTAKAGSEYLDAFQAATHVRMLASVRRSHLLDWRKELGTRGSPDAPKLELRGARKLSNTTINHHLEILTAILRTGWRNAEMLAPDLSKLNLPVGSNDRGAWEKEHLLRAMGELEPRSGAAWVFVIGLTTSTRLGETVAATKKWYNRRTGFIEVPKEFTKKKKPHNMPIIELIREPLVRHLDRLKDDDFMFDVPRPSNPKLKISHEASKWFARFRYKHKVPRVIHELRDTWIEFARNNETEVVKKELYEIITGHSDRTGSDGYGGERPSTLMKVNEAVCEDMLDAEMRAAILGLVS